MKYLQSLLPLSGLALCAALACGVAADEPQAQRQLPERPIPSSPEAGTARRVRLEVRETAGVSRTEEIAQTGIPLPRSARVRDPRSLTVVDASGKPVPADFRVLARWNAGKDDFKAPVQWLLVAFPASVEAGKSARFDLVLDGSAGRNPAPAEPLRVTREDGKFTVDTGAAVFQLGAEPGALFDEVRLPDGTRLAGGSAMTLETAGGRGGHARVRDVRIEHQGPLTAAIVVDGEYGLPAVGGGGFGSRRRYLFTAGSPTAIVRQAVAWEGNLACQGCTTTENGRPNGVLVQRVRDTLDLSLGDGPLTVTAVGAFESDAVERSIPAGASGGSGAAVRQLLRAERSAPLRFQVEMPGGAGAEGQEANGGMLAVSGGGGPGGTLAVALRQMHRYEPQALRLLPDGDRRVMAIDIADDRAWLAHHQGLFATFAVSALPGTASRADLDRRVWAPLNRPLRPWPAASWLAASGAAPELPAGPLPRGIAGYDEAVSGVLRVTQEAIRDEGIAGLMTFGVYPRYWGRWDSPELQCKGEEPPAQRWDDAFWCGTWTDYHNTSATAVLRAMRTGEVQWLDEIAFPAAVRTLHTQIMQCGPEEAWFYCGQAPAGYGGYRSDFNSSHAYFENLYLYYWLTGDSLVVDTLRQGGENMRRHMCESRGAMTVPGNRVHEGPGGPPCAADHPIGKASFTGRVAGQWLAAFHFLGLASGDPSFLHDFRSGLARAVTLQYAELEKNGRRYGFLGGQAGRGPGGSGEAGPVWTNGFYDGENLYRLMVDSNDAPIGKPAVRPSQVLAAVARTLAGIDSGELEVAEPKPQEGARAKTPGKRNGKKEKDAWPRLLDYRWEGPRIGGRLAGVTARDRDLFLPEKAGTAALLVRASRLTRDAKLRAAGERMTRAAIQASLGEGVPLGKLQGQYLNRLHAAVAGLAAGPGAGPGGRAERAAEPATQVP